MRRAARRPNIYVYFVRFARCVFSTAVILFVARRFLLVVDVVIVVVIVVVVNRHFQSYASLDR